VLAAGGTDSRADDVAFTDIFAADAIDWTFGPTMATGRAEHTATLLRTGQVLVAGGTDGTTNLTSAELYTPPTTATADDGAFGDQATGTTGQVAYLPVTDTGDEPLLVTGAHVDGANAGDFAIVSDSCTGHTVAPGATCFVGVRFTPTATGARTATLVLDDNAAGNATTASLGGNGTTPPTGPQGATGPQGGGGPQGGSGPQGSTGPQGGSGTPGVPGTPGATGPQGPAGKVELVTCTTTTRRVHRKRRRVRRCTTRVVSGTVRIPVSRGARASLRRRGRTYATGTAPRTGLVLLHARRALPPGAYTLAVAGQHQTLTLA
jgi:hypothetical protein